MVRFNCNYKGSKQFTSEQFIYSLFILIFLLALNVSPVKAQEATGSWEVVVGAQIDQGDRRYDRSNRLYYTENTISLPDDLDEYAELRLVVTSSSYPVVNATGLTSDNLPYFALTDTSQNVRIEFPRTRARFAVSLSVMQFIESQPQDSDGDGIFDTDDLCPLDPNNDIDNDEICGDVDRCPLDFDNDVDSDGICGDVDVCPLDPLNDSDGDGVCDGEDICPIDANNDCILIEGIVNGGGSAIANAQVELGNGGDTVFTSLSGDFSGNIQASTLSSDGSRQFFPINVKAQGFATGNAKVPFVPGQFNYRIVVSLQQVSDTIEESEDVTQSGGVEIVKNGNPVGSLEIPLTSLPTGVTQVTGTVTYLDPETEDLLSMPGGDLLALPEGADPNTDEPVILESFGMMEFNLFDQEGNEITTLSDDAEVCMKATSSLSDGDVVPLWYYDEDLGVWREEGQGTVEERNGMLLICGKVNHFSWWNYDRPIETHACMRFEMRDELTNLPIDAIDWNAEGATYSGTSPTRSCSDGDGSFDSFTVKMSTDTSPESIKVYGYIGGSKFYLRSDNDGTYSLVTDSSLATSFDTPDENGSCLFGNLTGTCWPLDYEEDGDGVLPVDLNNINLPPAITEFEITDNLIQMGSSVPLSVTVTDPEGGDVSLSWSTYCGYYGNSSGGSLSVNPQFGTSGTNFQNEFNAPDTLFYPAEYCEIRLEASDPLGNTSVATRWLTVTSSLNYDLSGVVYGIDGLPAEGLMVDYYNWECSVQLSSVTDQNGEYSFQFDISQCASDSEYYSLGELFVNFENDGNFWTYNSLLDNYYYGEFESFRVANVNGEQGCILDADSMTTMCRFDIRLPTLWSAIEGSSSYLPAGETHILSYFSHSFNELSGVYTYDAIELGENAQSYGPMSVPVGPGTLEVQSKNYGSYSQYIYTNIINQSIHVYDIGQIDGDVEVYVYDFDSLPLENELVTITSYSASGSTTSSNTDNNGFTSFEVPLGEIQVVSLNDNFWGTLRRADVPMVVELNSPNMCLINLTAYDPLGQPSTNAEYYVSQTGETVITDEFGRASFNLRAGNLYLYSLQSFYTDFWYDIDNCRMVNGAQREIDIVVTSYFYQDLQPSIAQ